MSDVSFDKPVLPPDRMGAALNFDGMSIGEMRLRISLYVMENTNKEIEKDIEDMQKSTRQMEKYNELLGVLGELQAMVGAKQTGHIGDYWNNNRLLEARLNTAIDACVKEGIDLSDVFTMPGKMPDPTQIEPMPEKFIISDEARNILQYFSEGRTFLSQYDRVLNGGYLTSDTEMKHLGAVVGDIAGRTGATTAHLWNVLGAEGWNNAKATELQDWLKANAVNGDRKEWWDNAPTISRGISGSTPVSEFLSSIKKLEGKLRVHEQDSQENMVEFNRKNSLNQFQTTFASEGLKAEQDMNRQIIGNW